jgi:hypothetical protein
MPEGHHRTRKLGRTGGKRKKGLGKHQDVKVVARVDEVVTRRVSPTEDYVTYYSSTTAKKLRKTVDIKAILEEERTSRSSLDRIAKETVPMSREDFRKIVSLSENGGIKTKWQDTDETLYGLKRKKPN